MSAPGTSSQVGDDLSRKRVEIPSHLTRTSARKRRVRQFYEQQNALIDALQGYQQQLRAPGQFNKSNPPSRTTSLSRETADRANDVELSVINEGDPKSNPCVNPATQSGGEGTNMDVETGSTMVERNGGDKGEGKEAVDSEMSHLSSPANQAIVASFAVNVILLGLKLWAVVMTGSIAVIASAVDSFLDILSGLVLVLSQRAAQRTDIDFLRYPEGKGSIEPLGVVVFATIMCFSSLNILIESAKVLIEGFTDTPPSLTVGTTTYAILATTIASKLLLFLACSAVHRLSSVPNPAVEAYAQDHLNDVFSNSASVVAVVLAANYGSLWFTDALGAIGISLYIMANWADVGQEQIDQLCGRSADAWTMQRLTFLAFNADERIKQIDTVRAFHFGMKYIAELHIVLPPTMPLCEAHDIGEDLERLVEDSEPDTIHRCFVHLDYETSHVPEYRRQRTK